MFEFKNYSWSCMLAIKNLPIIYFSETKKINSPLKFCGVLEDGAA